MAVQWTETLEGEKNTPSPSLKFRQAVEVSQGVLVFPHHVRFIVRV